MHVLEELAAQRKLLCPETRAPVELRAGRLVSPSGRDFGNLRGPLNFLRACEETIEASRVPAQDVARVRAHLELPADAEVDAQIAQAIAATGARFDRAHLSAEARILAERFRMPGFDVGPAPAARPGAAGALLGALGRMFRRTPADFRLEHLSNSVGERMTAAQPVYRSVRVRNAGHAALAMAGGAMAQVRTFFTRPDGAAVDGGGCVNDLPVDVEVGREITLILRVAPPDQPGTHHLHVQLLVGGEPVGGPFLSAPVEVIRCELPVFEYSYHAALLEYGVDHHVAMLEVVEYLQGRYPGRGAAVLEIGGGVHPTGHAIAAQGHRVVSSDISHSQSILGSLYFRHKMPQLDESLAFMSCDGSELPFAGGAFDGVMFFAAFHHFADPRALLREVARVIAADGFVFLGCDNCVPDPADPLYREELGRGINEQVWTLAEYAGFFREAGLVPVRARVDHHSLKVVLNRAA